jgi:flagellar protein FlaG
VEVAKAPPGVERDQRDLETRSEVQRLVDELNSGLEQLNQKLGFRVHDGTGQIMVQIVDRGSGEVLRESPPREFLDLAARMKEMVGLFLDEQG